MRLISFILLAHLFLSCTEPTTIQLSNTSTISLVEQPVVLERSDFDLQGADFIALFDADDDPVPVQFDDLNDDGIWDEIAVLLSFDPSSTLTLSYESIAKEELPTFPVKTSAYLGHSPNRDNNFASVESNLRPDDHVALSTPYLYQYEGPGWENDKVAFRAYFDSRNGKDIFGKTKTDLVVHSIGLGQNYHELQDWGMDVLKVGTSLGAGALAMLKNDSIYRLTNTKKASFKLVAKGPVRSIIELSYKGWQVDSTEYDITETISIWAGKRHYQSEVTLSGNGLDTLVTGIVDLKGIEAKSVENTATRMLYTHGKQSENNDVLGMALIVAKGGLVLFDKAPDEGDGVINTYTALLRPIDGVYKFGFYAGWELEDSAFSEEASFVDMLTAETTSMTGSITIIE